MDSFASEASSSTPDKFASAVAAHADTSVINTSHENSPLGMLSESKLNAQQRLKSSTSSHRPQHAAIQAIHLQPTSYSTSDLTNGRSFKTNSEVQGMVARFDRLDIKDHAELRKRDEAQLRRAQLGREEAEQDLAKVREQLRALKKNFDEGQGRERQMAKRIDILMEELNSAKGAHERSSETYEREIRKARKDAFKQSSSLVRLQEELKDAKNSQNVTQSNLDMEKLKTSRREQEAYTAQYQLISVEEGLDEAHSRIKLLEEERDALKSSLKSEEVARLAAEGRCALPQSRDGDESLLMSPRKPNNASRDVSYSAEHSQHQKQEDRTKVDLDRLKKKYEIMKMRSAKAEDMLEHMKLEVQFGCCACKLYEGRGIQPLKC